MGSIGLAVLKTPLSVCAHARNPLINTLCASLPGPE